MSGPQEDALTAPQPVVSKEDVAKGAGLAAVARLGALIEVVAQPAYTWMFGLAGYGVYVVLWAAINILANVLDLAFGQALQRIIPTTKDRTEEHGVVRFALLVSTGLGALAALAITLAAPWLASFVAADPKDAAILPRAIAIFAWSLPLWIFVETATAAAQAKRAFGPEIRLRIFWEQVARLVFAAGFFVGGFGVEGLLARPPSVAGNDRMARVEIACALLRSSLAVACASAARIAPSGANDWLCDAAARARPPRV